MPQEKPEKIKISTFCSPFGPLFFAATNEQVVDLAFDWDQNFYSNYLKRRYKIENLEIDPDYFKPLIYRLEKYFAGQADDFKDIKVKFLDGSDFHHQVWSVLRTIPYGQTRSYGDIAAQVGKPRAARAVGNANHNNPVGIIIPCHRVIHADGSLGGYGSRPDLKLKLLELEGVKIKS